MRVSPADVEVRFAALRDLPWLAHNDGHLDSHKLSDKVAATEIFVAESNNELTGLLRIDFLWSKVPFIAQVRVTEKHRRLGIGRTLVAALCDDQRSKASGFVLSSTTGGEAEPLAWHKAVGFAPCGEVTGIDGPGSVEVFLRRDL
jgi:N-acetylglutamate synthase-like GNAT family acetyltransferase